jgi:hypothetical protein
MLTIQVTSIDTAFNNAIKDFIYKEKHKWNYEFSYNFLKKLTKREWQKSCWWANYYTESNYCDPHHHKPETLSAILIVKSSSQNPLYFMENDKKYDVPEKDGMMLFFDSEYFHGVKECKEERITCTLDFIPKRRKQ